MPKQWKSTTRTMMTTNTSHQDHHDDNATTTATKRQPGTPDETHQETTQSPAATNPTGVITLTTVRIVCYIRCSSLCITPRHTAISFTILNALSACTYSYITTLKPISRTPKSHKRPGPWKVEPYRNDHTFGQKTTITHKSNIST